MIKFTSEEVALLLGLPNRGLKFEIGSGRLSGVTTNDIRHNIEEMDVSTRTEDLVKEFIVYLLANIFFPMGNFCVPTGIEEVANNVDTFVTYNWPESIRDFLVKEFNVVAEKYSKALEHAVFELKEANLKDANMQKLMSEEIPASMKPTRSACSEKSSSRTISSKNILSPSSVVAPTVVEQEQDTIQDVKNMLVTTSDKLETNEEDGLADKATGDSEEEGLASTCKSGIARRVQLRHDMKRKLVSTPLTAGPAPIAAVPSKSVELTPANADESIEVRAEAVAAAPSKSPELVHADAAPSKTTESDQIIVTEIDESIQTDPQAAPDILDYPGRELISVEKKNFIDKCLKYFKYR
ncbi:hypothetical protein M5K25_009840 [Dendrobium thyrsiflorum]|uniref:Uncharacterized protein n=1 Tax=Dendrobium thyrsiflorum TaxID=117978 RepID=A0ABD0VDI6_DENTH